MALNDQQFGGLKTILFLRADAQSIIVPGGSYGTISGTCSTPAARIALRLESAVWLTARYAPAFTPVLQLMAASSPGQKARARPRRTVLERRLIAALALPTPWRCQATTGRRFTPCRTNGKILLAAAPSGDRPAVSP